MSTSPITLPKTFGQKAGSAAKEERPASQFWLNVGYSVEVPNAEGQPETRFVSLPAGIPLDNIEALPVKGKNAEWNMFQSARNDLLAQLMEAAQALAPGEERIVSLEIQLRRVNNEEVKVDPAENPFARRFAI